MLSPSVHGVRTVPHVCVHRPGCTLCIHSCFATWRVRRNERIKKREGMKVGKVGKREREKKVHTEQSPFLKKFSRHVESRNLLGLRTFFVLGPLHDAIVEYKDDLVHSLASLLLELLQLGLHDFPPLIEMASEYT